LFDKNEEKKLENCDINMFGFFRFPGYGYQLLEHEQKKLVKFQKKRYRVREREDIEKRGWGWNK
jgi:hypothetical protein